MILFTLLILFCLNGADFCSDAYPDVSGQSQALYCKHSVRCDLLDYNSKNICIPDPLFNVYDGGLPEETNVDSIYITLFCDGIMKTVAWSGKDMDVDVCSMVNSAFPKNSFTNHCTLDFGKDVQEDYPIHNICNEIEQEDCDLVPFCGWDANTRLCDVDFCFWEALDFGDCSEKNCAQISDDRYSYCYLNTKKFFNSNFVYHTGASKNLTFPSTVFGTTYPLSILLFYPSPNPLEISVDTSLFKSQLNYRTSVSSDGTSILSVKTLFLLLILIFVGLIDVF